MSNFIVMSETGSVRESSADISATRRLNPGPLAARGHRSQIKKKSAEAGELGSSFGSVSEDERAAVAAFRALVGKYDSPKPPALSEPREAILKALGSLTGRCHGVRLGALLP